MSTRIRFDYPGHQTRRSLARLITAAIGALLGFIGLVSTVVAIPSGFITLGDIAEHIHPDTEPLFSPEFPLREVELAFAASVVVAIAGLRYGRRLIRGRRSSVLFLRRFGYRGSMQVVTYAVANTIGTTWLLVTLDDAEIAPVGVDTTSRLLFGAGERIVTVAAAVGRALMAGFQWCIGGMWLVAGAQILIVWPNWKRTLTDGTLDTYARIYSSLMERRVPVAYFDVSLPGAFAILGTGAAIGFAALLAMFIALLAAMPLFGFVIMASTSAEALHKAETEKTEHIAAAHQIPAVVNAVTRRARQAFASRLVVLRVAGSIWHQTVTALASVTAASIVDISEPTENILWEIEELERVCRGRVVLIGDHARIASWIDANGEPNGLATVTPIHLPLASLLRDREVLAYTTDGRGMRRFARALYGMLLELERQSADSR